MKYYIYQWVDPRNNEVIYIGKGTNDRYKSNSSRNKILLDKQKKINSMGLEVKKEIILEDLDENDAFEKEKEYIASIGRKDLGKGTLLNLTDGGDGISSNTASYLANERVLNGTHNFLTLNQKRLENGTHNLVGPEENNKRIKESRHNLVNDNPQKKRIGWKWISNPTTRESKRIDPKLLDEYVSNGWLLGNYNNPQKKGNWCS